MFGSTANQKEPEDKSLDFRLTTGFHAFVMVVLVLHFVFGQG
ncbi:MAG TPA: hypothetical protein VFB72_04405 [Verrucomicrobiae bacterium]|nr:hypothetical protein [Verrucomicrobiae bacterium]